MTAVAPARAGLVLRLPCEFFCFAMLVARCWLSVFYFLCVLAQFCVLRQAPSLFMSRVSLLQDRRFVM